MASISRFTLALFCLLVGLSSASRAEQPPNILWIYVDDMSDWVGCYGDRIAETPNIDRLAAGGIRFSRAYMPAPVCSTTRSALITGRMQTTLGLHQHRTMIKKPLPPDVLTVPELFRRAGYLTFNEAKDDYNFLRDRNLMYSPEFERPGYRSHMKGRDASWLKQLRGKRFFGQIQLAGGKLGGETGSKHPADSRVSETRVPVPPQYPDVPVFRNAIARHYEQIAETDAQVGAIVAALHEYDLWESTVVFFFTDHGCPLPRSKQFLYEEGTRVPLIVAGPHLGKTVADVRRDLVSGIDIAVTTLALAGIQIPQAMEGRDLFADRFESRDQVIMARDRLGIAVDHIRSVRTDKYRYIRNYKTDRPLYQSQYRDKYATFTALTQLHAAGKLSPLQASYYDAEERPGEELYEVAKDPHQIDNLAGKPEYATILADHRARLKTWEERTGDQGRLPESPESLRKVYQQAKGKAPAPEFDFLRGEAR